MRKKLSRREFVRKTALAGALIAMPGVLLSGCGSKESKGTAPPSAGAGEQAKPAVNVNTGAGTLKIGFIPLTDCASVVMAKELGLYQKYGVKVEVSKEASWPNIRDKLLSGDLQAAHCLFGMPFSVYTGVGGPAGKELPIAMMINNNGQAITLAKELASVGRDVTKVKAAVDALKTAGKEPTFAMTFPGGTHDMWLRYWLAAAGVDQGKVKIIPIPPPQMVANMKVGNMHGFCVGEPWNGVAVKQEIGFTHITSQEIWKHHPEKALVLNKEFSQRKDEVKAVMKAVLEASQWLDDMKNRRQAAKVIGAQSYVNAPPDVIEARLMGQYDLGAGLGKKEYQDDTMLFHSGGKVNFPRKAHGIWYVAQYVRFGMLSAPPDYKKVADTLVLQNLYREVAQEMKIPVPDDDMKPFTVDLDKVTFDPADPAGSLKKYGGSAS